MKVNVPEKIYLFKNLVTETPDDRWLSKKSCNDDIEYVHTDAFIEKAAEWIKNKAENYIVDTPLCSYFDYKRAVENFKEYIKGE